MIQTELVASFRQRSSFSTGPRGMPPAAYQGSNVMDPLLCGLAFMSHNGSSSQTQP